MSIIDDARRLLSRQPAVTTPALDEPTRHSIRTVEASEWRDVLDVASCWDRMHWEVGQQGNEFWTRTISQSDAGEHEATHWRGPFDSLDTAATFGDAILAPHTTIERETERPEADPVSLVHESGWRGIDGIHEVQTCLGQSDEGWHFMVEVSANGADANAFWSDAYPTREEAEAACRIEEERLLAPIEQQAMEQEEREIAQVDLEHDGDTLPPREWRPPAHHVEHVWGGDDEHGH